MAIKQSWACYEVITSRKELAPWSYHLSEWPRFCSAQCDSTPRKRIASWSYHLKERPWYMWDFVTTSRAVLHVLDSWHSKQYLQASNLAIHYLSAVVLPFISGCHTVWGCFVDFSRSRRQSTSSKKLETSGKLQKRAPKICARFQFFPKFRVSCLICFAS